MPLVRILGWVMAVTAAAAGTAMVVTGMIEDLIQVVRERESRLARQRRR